MDLYSVTLGGGLTMAVVALVTAFAGWFMQFAGTKIWRTERFTSVAALVMLGVAGLSHSILGHHPSSSAALSPVDFVLEHPALFVAALMVVIAVLTRRARRRSLHPLATRGRDA